MGKQWGYGRGQFGQFGWEGATSWCMYGLINWAMLEDKCHGKGHGNGPKEMKGRIRL